MANRRASTLAFVIVVSVLSAHATILAQECPVAEPPATNCAIAREIPGTVGHHVVLTERSNIDIQTPFCGTTTRRIVWFSVMPDVTGPMTISTCHPATTYDTILTVFSGGDAACGSMTQEACIDDWEDEPCDNGCSFWGSEVTIHAIAGVQYRFVVGDFAFNDPGCAGCLGVTVTIGQPCGDIPTNLTCPEAISLPGTPGEHTAAVDVTDAVTLDVEPEPTCTGPQIGNSVWFKTTPSVDGLATFSTCTGVTNFDTVVQVYEGNCGVLAAVGCNDDGLQGECVNDCSEAPRGSHLSFEVQSGSDYYIQVGSYDNNSAACGDPLCLETSLRIVDQCALDLTPPVAELSGVNDLACLCPPVEFTGSADDADGTFEEYFIEYRALNSPNWNVITTSTEPVISGVLGSWDLNGVAQGLYVVRLTTRNVCGATSTTERVVHVDALFDTISVRAPLPDDVRAGIVCFDGTVADNYCFDQYMVGYRSSGMGGFQPVDPSQPVYTQSIINDQFATWDTIAAGVTDGVYEAQVSGDTICGASASQSFPLVIDNTPPITSIDGPLSCDAVEGVVSVFGTVFDDNLASWVLQVAGPDSTSWTTLDSGNQSVIDGLLGTWDTSGLEPCAYALRVVAADQAVRNCNSAITNRSEEVVLVEIDETGCVGDLDNDRDVDLADFAVFQANFGNECP